MRIQFCIENPRQLKPACRSKMLFTARGGVIGASQEADWPLQDMNNFLPDFLARIELRDNKWLITAFPGANVFLNKSSSPLRPNKAVILRSDDLLSFGDLKVYLHDNFDENFEYAKYNDAIDLSTLVPVNGGSQDIIEGKAQTIEHQVPFDQSYSREARWSGHSLVETDRVDVLLDAIPDYQAERISRNKPSTEWEKRLNVPTYQGSLLEASQSPENNSKWRSEFDDFEADERIDAVEVPAMAIEREPSPKPVSQAISKDTILAILSRGLGFSLEDLTEAEIVNVLDDLAQSFRAAADGINALYRNEAEEPVNPLKTPATMQAMHAIDDNPLRFSKDGDEALRVMFLERYSVHLTPRMAVKDALEQVQANSASVTQSVEAGLDAVLQSFDPETLEARFDRYRRDDEDMNAQARDDWYWRTYRAYIQEMSNRRQKGLSRLFWDVFQKTHHDALRRFNQNKNSRNIGE